LVKKAGELLCDFRIVSISSYAFFPPPQIDLAKDLPFVVTSEAKIYTGPQRVEPKVLAP
jgi:hypothetical protein